MTTAVTAFVCNFCPRKKRFAKRETAENHEYQCFHNPRRRACITCKHLTIEPYEMDTGAGGASCEFELIPILATPESPERMFTFDCEKWQAKQQPEGGIR